MDDKNTDLNWMTYNFKKEIIDSINKSGLPGILVYEILNGITLQIQNQIETEMKQKD